MDGFRAFVIGLAKKHNYVEMTPVRTLDRGNTILRFRHVDYNRQAWFEVRCIDRKQPEGLLIGATIGSRTGHEYRRIITWTDPEVFMQDFEHLVRGCVPAHVTEQWGTHIYCNQCPKQLMCLSQG